MAEAAAQHHEATAPSLGEAIHAEGLEPVGTVAHEGVAPHTDPKAVNAATSAAATLIAQGHDAPSDKALVDSAIGKLGTIN